MSVTADSPALLDPIDAERPCGEDVEYTVLPALDASRIFGQKTGIAAPPDWAQVRGLALEGLQRSKDLRVLAYWSAAVLRTDGLEAFTQALTAGSEWLTRYWDDVYPRIDEDAVIRRNALNCLADPAAIVEALRRLPLVSSRQHGTFSLRDVEIANGHQPQAEGESRPDPAQVAAAFSSAAPAALGATHAAVLDALAALRQMETAMAAGGGPDVVPVFDPLAGVLARMDRLLRTHVAANETVTPDPNGPDGEPSVAAGGAAAPARAPGTIGSREDALAALEAVADYFRRHEPSSPVPLLLDRARRLVAKSFLEILADMAPDGLAQARSAGGVTEGE